MLNGYHKTIDLYHTNNDDAIYSLLIYLNNYKVYQCSNYDIYQLLRNNTKYDRCSLSKTQNYKKSSDKIFTEWINRMEKNINTNTNEDYICYYKSIYNIGDVFSDYLFNSIYDKNKLLNVHNRKKIYFIGSEIPTKGWMDKNKLCCGMGWRDKNMNLDPKTVCSENFCYTRGKISK